MLEQLDRINRNHLAIQSLPTERLQQVFGSRSHRFRLNPPLPLAEVEAFERRHSVSLPEEYRTFLLEFADGGAGPFHGLFRLRRTCGQTDTASCQLPCLLRPDLEQYGENWLQELGVPDWEERIEVDDNFPYQGTIAIAEHGCGGYEVLILNGPYRGQVYSMTYNNGIPPGPSLSPGSNFLEWYEAWQDTVLSRRSDTHFGFR